MWLVVHHPLLRPDRGAGLPKQTLDRLFLTSLEVIEFSRLLETENATRKWGWLFATYQQWHAMAYLLSQLTIRTKGPEVERAWAVVDVVFQEWHTGDPTTKKGMLWKPLRKMMVRARAARNEEMKQRNRFPLDGSLGPAVVSPNTVMQTVRMMPGLSPDANPLDYTNMLPFVQSPTPTVYMNGNNHQGLNVHNPPGRLLAPNDQRTLPTALTLDPVYQPQPNGHTNGDMVDQWLYDEASYPQEQWVGDPNMAWAGWDDMVKDFQIQNPSGEPQILGAIEGMPMVGGVTNWW